MEINILKLKKLEKQLKVEDIHSEKDKKLLTWLKFLTNPDSMEDNEMELVILEYNVKMKRGKIDDKKV